MDLDSNKGGAWRYYTPKEVSRWNSQGVPSPFFKLIVSSRADSVRFDLQSRKLVRVTSQVRRPRLRKLKDLSFASSRAVSDVLGLHIANSCVHFASSQVNFARFEDLSFAQVQGPFATFFRLSQTHCVHFASSQVNFANLQNPASRKFKGRFRHFFSISQTRGSVTSQVRGQLRKAGRLFANSSFCARFTTR